MLLLILVCSLETQKKQVEEELATERGEANVLRWQLQNKSAKMTDLENELRQSREREKRAQAKVSSSPGSNKASPSQNVIYWTHFEYFYSVYLCHL